MENLNVIIDGVKYTPEDEKLICIHGIQYTDIENWLLNVHAVLVNNWYKEAIKHDGDVLDDIPELVKFAQDIKDFDVFCKKYLGFENTSCGYKEVNSCEPEYIGPAMR